MILVTHTDLDGVGCEIVARYFYSSLTEVHHCHCDAVDRVVCKLLSTTNEQILVTDLSINQETAVSLDKKYRDRIKIYDHHKTAKAHLDQYPWVFIDTTRSATKILFDTLHKQHPSVAVAEGLEKLVFHVDDYDLWHHSSPLSTHFNDILSMIGLNLFCKAMLERIRQNRPLISNEDQFYLQGLAESKEKYFAGKVKSAIVIDNRLVVMASRHTSDLGQYIRDISPAPADWEQVDYIDMLNFENQVHSLRSYKKDFDVSQVAKENGGGGHPSAAGYPMKISDNLWLKKF